MVLVSDGAAIPLQDAERLSLTFLQVFFFVCVVVGEGVGRVVAVGVVVGADGRGVLGRVCVSPRAAFSRAMFAEAGVMPWLGRGALVGDGEGLRGRGGGLGFVGSCRGVGCFWDTLATTFSVREVMSSVGICLPNMETRVVANVWNISCRSCLESVIWSVGVVVCGGGGGGGAA